VGNRYEVGLQRTTTTAAGMIAALVTASGSRAVVREIGVSVATVGASSAPEVGLGRPAAAGTGTLTGTLGQALDSADVASLTTLTTTNFGTANPTAPTNFFRRFQLPNIQGAGIVWVWEPQEFVLPISANLVIWQFGSIAVTYDVYVKWAE
jgi:hypothetical protein